MTAPAEPDWALLAAIHAEAFGAGPPRPWSPAEIAKLARLDGAALRVAGAGPLGFALARAAGGEAELLTLAVRPSAQGAGLGAALLSAVETAAATLGATRMILEVSERNAPARRLYARAAYAPLGRRRGYFDGVDALLLSKEISPARPVAKP